MKRGRLRIYLGSAPGAGKTYAMLAEGIRRATRGTDVVIGLIETHDRPHTAEMVDELSLIPRKTVRYRGTSFTEMDLDAIVERSPDVVLVDELAHTNVPGSKHDKRFEDIDEILDAGIDVISTVNIQHIESLTDVVETITGAHQQETVPDAFVRSADQIELADITPEALRRRMAHGNIYAADKIDTALANYFRTGNLTALRELALLWLADQVDEGMQRYRAEHGIADTWETRERVVIALPGGAEGKALIRRGARIAARAHADLLAVHVSRSDGLTGANPAVLAEQRALIESMGGTYHQVLGEDVSSALLDFARSENATQLVLGASRRSQFRAMLTGPGIGTATINESGDIDVHLVTHAQARGRGRTPVHGSGLSRRRRILAFVLAGAGLPILTVVLRPLRDSLGLSSDLMLFMLLVVLVSMVGGRIPGLIAAVAGALLLNFSFADPTGTLTIADGDTIFALVVFIAVAAMVSSLVHAAARRARQAAGAAAEAQTLSTLAGSVLRGRSAVSDLLAELRSTFAQQSVGLVSGSDRDGWELVDSVGDDPPAQPSAADTEIPVVDGVLLLLRGRALPAANRRVMRAFALQIAAAREQQRLSEAADAALPVLEADRTRTALLAAVSYDLRTPLASARGAVARLTRQVGQLSTADLTAQLSAAGGSLDRLRYLVDNLLDMSRLEAGAVSTFPQAVAPAAAVDHALGDIGDTSAEVLIEVDGAPPDMFADPALLERVLVNLIVNALRYSPAGSPPTVLIGAVKDVVEIRIVDHGPGVAEQDKEHIFAAFQRRGGEQTATGIGMGLSLSRGLTDAMDGTLEAEDTPGGGLTMVLTMSIAPASAGTVPIGVRESAAADVAAVADALRQAASVPGEQRDPVSGDVASDHAAPDHAAPDHATAHDAAPEDGS